MLLVGAAMLYSRRVAAKPVGNPTPAGSMPGNAGTGVQQILGGILGSVFSGAKYGNTPTGSPNAQTVMDNINFFATHPVNDVAAVPDWSTAPQEVIDNMTQFGV
jgi:hypothetical protein